MYWYVRVQWVLGISVALIGAAIMWDGSLFGEDTAGIATVIGIVGLLLIATAARKMRTAKERDS